MVEVLLLLNYCLMYFPLFVGNLCLSLFCYALLYVHSSFAHLKEKEKTGCFAKMIVLQMYCYYKCYVTLPYGAVGWSAVCHCGIS